MRQRWPQRKQQPWQACRYLGPQLEALQRRRCLQALGLQRKEQQEGHEQQGQCQPSGRAQQGQQEQQGQAPLQRLGLVQLHSLQGRRLLRLVV